VGKSETLNNEHRIMITKCAVFFLVSVFMIRCLNASSAHAMLSIKASQEDVNIDFFYHGDRVSFSGEADEGTDLVIKIASPASHQVMKKKGKVGGFLWMTVGTVKFEQTPSLYHIHSTRALDEILSDEEQKKYMIGYPALRKQAEIVPLIDEADKDHWLNEFVMFQEQQRLYAISIGNITSTQLGNGRQKYSVMTDWPYQAAPGKYTATIYEVKDKKVLDHAATIISVEQIGIVKTLSSMAKDRAALYGLLSVGIALAAGFGVGILFRKGGGSH
jgi:uncharacterized protein (TIGR02186 family)